uniref:Uncharacterized protein n=1 Tax=Caenorhabditis tropicalis TaxID=1561998 RepID=A0A1I7UGE1_9PELO
MCDSNDCLSQEIQELDKEKAEMNDHKSLEKNEEQLRHNLHDQISLMNVDQMAEVHNWLKHSDVEDIEKI